MPNEFKDDIVFARFIKYMKKALLHRKINYLKHRNFLRKQELQLDQKEWDVLSTKDDMEHSFFAFKENNENKQRILNILTEKQRQVINALYYEEKSVETIAKDLKLTPNAIYQIKFRAMEKLKKYLKGENKDGKWNKILWLIN